MAQSEFWNKLKTRIKEVSIAAADFTEEQAVIGKLKFEILTLKRKSEQVTKQLGAHIFNMSELTDKPSPFDDYEVKEFIREITDLRAQIEVKRSEIDVVADNFRSKKSTDSSEFYASSTDITENVEDSEPPKPKRKKAEKKVDTSDDTTSEEEKPKKRRKYTRKTTATKTTAKTKSDSTDGKVKSE